MITVLDKGPTDKPHETPVQIRMHSVDARDAIAADPERYSEVHRDVVLRKPGSIEDRLASIEERLDAIEADDADLDEPQPATADEPQPRTEPYPKYEPVK